MGVPRLETRHCTGLNMPWFEFGRLLRHKAMTLFAFTGCILCLAGPASAQWTAATPPIASPPSGKTAVSPKARSETSKPAVPKPQHAKDAPAKLDPMKPHVASMEVTIVRSNEPGCEPDCFEWISADGMIDKNSPVRLKKVLARLGNRKLPLFINSPGGSVDDAISLAGIIRARGIDVVVARTDLQHCAPNDANCNELKAKSVRLGSPTGLARCASSCPFVLAGGVRRMVGSGAYVGVHRAATYRIVTRVMRTYRVVPRYEWGIPTGTTRKLVSEKSVGQSVKPIETTKDTYDKIEMNFAAMGISKEIMKPMLATPNAEMRWLTQAEIESFRLVTERLNGQQVLGLSRRTGANVTGAEARERAGTPLPGAPGSAPVRPAAAAEPRPAETPPPFSFGLPITAPASVPVR